MIKEENIKVGITLGDPNGIGGEIILKAFEDPRVIYKRLLKLLKKT